RGELVSAAEIVHTLKGSTGNLGAQAIHSRLNELHEALRARDDAAVQSALQPLAERFPQLIASLQAALWSART
ncbi:MAG: Hpt domain-containing protein, partial [Propionivibrio sp.]|nr:Hpt domain-containing protein [Propionivibrio sp.]